MYEVRAPPLVMFDTWGTIVSKRAFTPKYAGANKITSACIMLRLSNLGDNLKLRVYVWSKTQTLVMLEENGTITMVDQYLLLLTIVD